MSELGEHSSPPSSEHDNIYDEQLDPVVPSEIIRSADGAIIKIVAGRTDINCPPHAIGSSYVTEGLVLPAQVTKNLYIKHGRGNSFGGGHEVTETKLEMVPLVLMQQTDESTAWIDTTPFLLAADTAQLDGHKVSFAKFDVFEGAMDLNIVTDVLNKAHLEKFSPANPFKLIKTELQRILELDENAVTVLALWIAMSYVHDAFEAFPYLWFNGVKGSGKTTALEFIRSTAYHAEMGMRISNPALFRDVDNHRCTVCYDEAENLLVGGGDRGIDQDRVSLFNSGYRASGAVRLVEKDGDNFVTRRFRSYSPKALASIHPIDEALQSRCLLINMMVALDPQKSAEAIDDDKCAEIRRQLFLLRFGEGIGFHDAARDSKKNALLKNGYDLKNRDWELFKPLLIGAARICPDWLPDVARFIDSQRVIRQIDNQLSTDATVLLKIHELMREAENAPDDARTCVTYKELMHDLKEDFPEMKWLTTKSIGYAMRRMGLGSMTVRYGKGYVIKFDRDLILTQMKRLGVEEHAMVNGPQKTIEAVVG